MPQQFKRKPLDSYGIGKSVIIYVTRMSKLR